MSGWIAVAAANALIAVLAGAYAAHGLEAQAGAEAAAWAETASRYQMWHALGLIAVVLLGRLAGPGTAGSQGWLRLSRWAFLGGIVLFSGSLYVMALSGYRGLAWITPLGGFSFLVGWAAVAVHALRRRDKEL